MRDNRSDRIMVQSTIALAHSLGRTVSPRGSRTPEILEPLRDMDCDIAQAFIVGRPMSFDELVRRMKASASATQLSLPAVTNCDLNAESSQSLVTRRAFILTIRFEPFAFRRFAILIRSRSDS